MPKKTVEEMNPFERMHYSLEGKTFRSMLLISLILSAAAIAFGFFLYSSSVRREYRSRTWQMSQTASKLLDLEETRREASMVIEIYDAMSPREREGLKEKEPELLSRFDGIRGEGFEAQRELMRLIQEYNEGVAAYTAFLDPETSRMVFIADSDPKQSFCPPGYWDQLKESECEDLMEGDQLLLDKLYGTPAIPCAMINMEPYGRRCTAGTFLFELEGYQVFAFFDTDMNEAAQVSAKFFWSYLGLMLLITVIVLGFSVRSIRHNVGKPINQLAEAAQAYIQDRNDDHRGELHFSKLNIRTGDEIEKLALTMKSMETDMGSYIQNLTRITAEKERLGTELSLATKIQAAMMPHIFPPFPGRPEIDIYASMDPAKEVGGDFYDFFLVDEDHLCMVMADVSGKGIPAALFMMASKIILQSCAMLGQSPVEILTRTNEAICSNNQEEMFVTVWVGILEISTGKLTAANAGHEYPVLRGPGGKYSLVKDKHGFVIGGLDGIRYSQYEMELKPGSSLFLYTDGAPEATNREETLFGLERMLEALNKEPEAGPRRVLENVRLAIDDFVQDAEQFDDLTMLCMQYLGPKGQKEEENMKELTVEATLASVEPVTDFVNEQLEALGCPMKTQIQIDVAIDELMSNIARYAYNPDTGPATVRVDVEREPMQVVITFIDHGKPFDPLAAAEPDVKASLEDRGIGGLGIFLVKKTMDDVSYEYKDGQNILRIKKQV